MSLTILISNRPRHLQAPHPKPKAVSGLLSPSVEDRWAGDRPQSWTLSSRKPTTGSPGAAEQSHLRTPLPHLTSRDVSRKAPACGSPCWKPGVQSLPPAQGFVPPRQPSSVMKSQAHGPPSPLPLRCRGGAGGTGPEEGSESKHLFLLSEIPAVSVQAPRHRNALKASAFSLGQFSSNKILKWSLKACRRGLSASPGHQSPRCITPA